MNTRFNTLAQDIKEITTGVSSILELLEESMTRKGSEDEHLCIPPNHEGGLIWAAKHLNELANWHAESLEEEELRLAEISAQRDAQGGRV